MARKKLSEMTPEELLARMRSQGSNLDWSLGLQTVKNARAQLRRLTGLDNEDIGHLFTSGLTYAEWLEVTGDHNDAPEGEQKEDSTMAAKTLTARQSIEAAFDGSTSKKLKAKDILAHVAENPKSKIGQGTIRTQLQVQSTKGAWIKRVAPGTYQLVKNAPAEGQRTAAPKNDEVTPDLKPTRQRGRKQEPVAA